MNYEDSTRGKILYPKYRMRFIDYSGIRYGNGTPTDIDGMIEMHDELFIFFEFKFNGSEMPFGQKLAITRLVDAVQAGGKDATLLICSHCEEDKDIDAANSVVESLYFKKHWYSGLGRTAKAVSDNFISFVKEQSA